MLRTLLPLMLVSPSLPQLSGFYLSTCSLQALPTFLPTSSSTSRTSSAGCSHCSSKQEVGDLGCQAWTGPIQWWHLGLHAPAAQRWSRCGGPTQSAESRPRWQQSSSARDFCSQLWAQLFLFIHDKVSSSYPGPKVTYILMTFLLFIYFMCIACMCFCVRVY